MTNNLSNPSPKHIPERTCAACRAKRPQAEFVRLTKLENLWSIQTGRLRTGRGVYLCADSPACWHEKKLRRAFGAQAPQVSENLHLLAKNKSNMGQPMND